MAWHISKIDVRDIPDGSTDFLVPVLLTFTSDDGRTHRHMRKFPLNSPKAELDPVIDSIRATLNAKDDAAAQLSDIREANELAFLAKEKLPCPQTLNEPSPKELE